MNELRELTKAFTFKFSLDDIRDDVPEQTVTIVRVQAPREVEDLGTLIRATVGEEQPITVPARLGAHGQVITARKDTLYIDHHFSLDSTLRRLGSVHGGKKERLYDMYPNPTKESPLLVLCAFKDTALEIAEHYGVQAYCGGIQLTDEIQYGKVLVGTISALKQSISLEHISEGVLLTPDWSSITLRQILGRMRRLTSQYDINLTIMVSSVAIDPRVWRVVDNKLKGIELYDSMVNKTKDLAEEQTVEVRKQMLANRLTNAVNKIVAKLPIGDVLVKYDNAQSLGVLKRALFIYRKDSGMPHYIHRINFVCLDDMQAWGMRAKEMKYKVVATLTVKELV